MPAPNTVTNTQLHSLHPSTPPPLHPPTPPRATMSDPEMPVVVIDNGGHSIKAGIVTPTTPSPSAATTPNMAVKPSAVRKTYVGREVDECVSRARVYLRRPHSRGHVLNWNLQTRVWANVLRDLSADPAASAAFLLLPGLLPPPDVLLDAVETVFEEIGFARLALSSPPAVLARHHMASTGAPAALVVDAGFSATWAVPFYAHSPVTRGIRRLDVAGKALANRLKRLVSYRSLDISKEFLLAEHIKDSVCRVDPHYLDTIKTLSAGGPEADTLRDEITVRYALPDYLTSPVGSVLPPDHDPRMMGSSSSSSSSSSAQILSLTTETISVPETLFHPEDAGIDEIGLPALIADALAAVPSVASIPMASNIIPTGGTFAFPNLLPRLLHETRSLLPPDLDLSLAPGADLVPSTPDNPYATRDNLVMRPFRAAAALASNPGFVASSSITKAIYDEEGFSRIESFFLDL